jgi:hypothetical protein
MISRNFVGDEELPGRLWDAENLGEHVGTRVSHSTSRLQFTPLWPKFREIELERLTAYVKTGFIPYYISKFTATPNVLTANSHVAPSTWPFGGLPNFPTQRIYHTWHITLNPMFYQFQAILYLSCTIMSGRQQRLQIIFFPFGVCYKETKSGTGNPSSGYQSGATRPIRPG